MPCWYYFGRPTNTAFHNFCESTTKIPPNLELLLGLGSKFIPTPFCTNNDLTTTHRRLERSLSLKTFFAGETMDDEEDFDPRVYVPSKWTPKSWMLPNELRYRFSRLRRKLEPLFQKKKGTPNLLPTQRKLLHELRNNDDIIVVECDKNLGPAVIERSKYILKVLEHLEDDTTYKPLTAANVDLEIKNINNEIDQWLRRYEDMMTKMEKKFVTSNRTNVLPYFYMTIKAHKNPWSLRPITACRDSILAPLGTLVDRWLHQVAKTMPTYVKNSADLKQNLESLKLPENARLFTADAVSMYTNINTEAALSEIAIYLRRNRRKFPDVPINALISGLEIVMTNNVFSLGDTFWKQISGAAMGQSPSPPYATVFFGIHELNLIEKFSRTLLPYCWRYIDDFIGVWIPMPNNGCEGMWKRFQQEMNNFHGLTWEFSERQTTVDYLDVTVSIYEGKIHFDLFEKALNLYLYIPPLSAHPPGVLTGMVMGNCHRIYSLVSNTDDQRRHLTNFFNRLIRRGYNRGTLLPLFQRAALRARTGISQTKVHRHKEAGPTFYHLQYHPNDPTSSTLQHHWKNEFSEPIYEKPFADIRNRKGVKTGITRMIVAYSRPPNLGNILSRKNLSKAPPEHLAVSLHQEVRRSAGY